MPCLQVFLFQHSFLSSLRFAESSRHRRRCPISGVVGCIVFLPHRRMLTPGLTPFHYLLEGMLAVVVHGQPVVCTANEFAEFYPPQGQTCQQWAGPYVQQMGGYLQDPSNTTLCQYCIYANGDQYVTFRVFLANFRRHLCRFTSRTSGGTMEFSCMFSLSSRFNCVVDISFSTLRYCS